MLADFFRQRQFVSDAGIEFGRYLRPKRFIKWEDVSGIYFKEGYFILITQTKLKVFVSVHCLGLAEFARLSLMKIPSNAMSNSTRSRLIQAQIIKTSRK
jgi:hypothetical protein